MRRETFYDQVVEAVEPLTGGCYCSDWYTKHEIVQAVFDMPQMEAIRQFILDTAINNGITPANGDHPFWRLPDGTRLQQSVIDWALTEEEE